MLSVLIDNAAESRDVLQRMPPLGRQIADVIRRDILFGRLKPGEALSQQQLCERYGTSRMPARDALRQLAVEGFVVDDGSRHCVVSPLSRGDMEDIYRIEGLLHALATRRVTERRDPAEIRELQERHERMLAVGGRDVVTMAALNYDFHRRINQLARSTKLTAVIRTHAMNIPRDLMVQIPEWAERANEQHAVIMGAISKGRGATAERLMMSHVIEAGGDLIDYLESHGLQLG